MKYDAFSKYHPLVCFLFFLGAIGFGVVIQHPAYLLAGCIGASVYCLLLRGRQGIGMLLAFLPLFLFLSAINPLFNTYGKTVLFSLFGRPYTLEALYHGLAVSAIFVITMLWFICYSTVLTSDKFVSLFGSLIPSLSLLLVMVLRMIPNLMRKAAQLINARRSIGKGGGETSTNREKLLGGMTILSALTDHALEGSIVTGDSMRARGYGAAKRTTFQIYRMTARDWVVLLVLLILAAVTILAGGMDAVYTPELAITPPGWGLAAYGAYLLLPTILHIKEAVQWHISISRI